MNKRTSNRPTKDEFLKYARSRNIDERRAADQWQAWEDGDWRDGKGFVIVNWKLKVLTFSRRGFGMFPKPDQREDKRAADLAEKKRVAETVERRNREDQRRTQGKG
jgi:hypothetical protein